MSDERSVVIPNLDMSKFVVGQVYVEYLNKTSDLFLLLKIEEKHDEKFEGYHWYQLTFLVNDGDSPVEITFRSDGYFCAFCEKFC